MAGIKRKIFYTMMIENGVVGVKEQDGYEIEIDGEKYNAYTNHYSTAYIIDEQTGIAVLTYYFSEGEEQEEIEILKKAKYKLLEGETLEKMRKSRNRESYKIAIKMFEAYKRADELREQQKEAVSREIEADRKNGKGAE